MEWLAHWTCNSAVPGSSPALATLDFSYVISILNPLATLVKSQVCLLPVGVFNPVMLYRLSSRK